MPSLPTDLTVELTAESAAAAIGQATNVGEGNDIRLEFDYSTTEGYPIVAVAYEIVCSAGLDADTTELLKSFLGFTASPDGQAELGRIGFVPLPESVESNVVAAVAAIQ